MPPQRRVAITGLGLVTPLGLTVESFWENLSQGKSGVAPFALAKSSTFQPLPYAAAAPFTGDIDDFGTTDLVLRKTIRKAAKLMSREIQMAVAAAQRAVLHAKLDTANISPDRVGISVGCDYIVSMPEEFLDAVPACWDPNTRQFDFSRWGTAGLDRMTPVWQLKYLPNMPASHIAICNDFHGPSNSITVREASIGPSVAESVATIEKDRTDVMLVGATGTRLLPAKLLAAMLQEQLATAAVSPESASRPFDQRRLGCVLGEGAGILILEEWGHAEKRGATIYGEVLGGCSAVAIDRDGTPHRDTALQTAITKLLAKTGISPKDVGHISAHGLATQECDIQEAAAIARVFADTPKPVPVTAMKSYMGNLGAGSGAVELIAGVLSLYHRRLIPVRNYSVPDPLCPIAVARSAEISPGDTCLQLSVTPQSQASAVLIRSVES